MSHSIPTALFVHDRGRMCNNILQFGHVYAWARENGCKAISMRFAYKYQYFRLCHTRWHSFLIYVIAKFAAKIHLLPTIDFDLMTTHTEKEQESRLREHRWAWVDGWHVRFYDLFEKYFDEIRAMFDFDTTVENTVLQRMEPWISKGDCLRLGVHIRRGDYDRFMNGKYFYDDDAMLRWIGQFKDMYPSQELAVFVCGNDTHLRVDYYRKNRPDINFIFCHGNPGEDLCMLSHCNYIIGAPSTFSLVASMYRDVPIWWIPSKEAMMGRESFTHFKTLFRLIDTYHSA